MDVRRLKLHMWDLLSTPAKPTEPEESKEEDENDPNKTQVSTRIHGDTCGDFMEMA